MKSKTELNTFGTIQIKIKHEQQPCAACAQEKHSACTIYNSNKTHKLITSIKMNP